MKDRTKIDFVILWVDGNDPEWKKQKEIFAKKDLPYNSRGNKEERFREWDQLRYWFRGVEKNAPWVNKIHFVTCGHLPEWLNTTHPKLHIVRHEDIIPNEYLPVFSSNPIELCINNIYGLSEQFVYFNDDIFLLSPVNETFFFRDGLPCCNAEIIPFPTYGSDHFWYCSLLQNMRVINKNFDSRSVMKKHWRKFINPVYGRVQNKCAIHCFPWRRRFFPFFKPTHTANPYLKSVLTEVWEKEKEELLNTCSHRFRSYDDVCQFLFLWWQFCKGQFTPTRIQNSFSVVVVSMDSDTICKTILNHEKPILCLNDTSISYDEFIEKKEKINKAFEELFPEKSTFEK